jgi:ABC-type antimicrobial peptide transport system permease subunit
MSPLVVTVGKAGGRGRAVLVAACTALVTGFLLVAVSMLRLGDPYASGYRSGYVTVVPMEPLGRVFTPLNDPSTRSGVVFGVVLLTVPFLALLNQGVRLGTAARRRRYDALAVVGATRSDLRRCAALEVGAPGAAGAVLGIGVYWLMRFVLGIGLEDNTIGALVPPHVGPGLWTAPVVVVVSALAFVAGTQSVRTRGATAERGSARTAVWLLVLLAGAALMVLGSQGGVGGSDRQVAELLALSLLVAGLAGLTPAVTVTVARAVSGRVSSPHLLLAARRLELDATSASRAGLASGAAGLTLGACAMLTSEVWHYGPLGRREYTDATFLVAGLAVLAFLLVGIALAVHITDSVLAERRAYASLSATGFPTRSLVAALRSEALIATLPIAVTGCVLGTVGYSVLSETGNLWVGWTAGALAATVVAAVASSYAASAVLAPVVSGAIRSGAIRTE